MAKDATLEGLKAERQEVSRLPDNQKTKKDKLAVVDAKIAQRQAALAASGALPRYTICVKGTAVLSKGGADYDYPPGDYDVIQVTDWPVDAQGQDLLKKDVEYKNGKVKALKG